jgi:hypothetical protein
MSDSQQQDVPTVEPTLIHTWLIIIGALTLLWLLGGIAFRTVRQ